MSHRAMTWAVDQRTGSPARKAVLMNLADRADAVWLCWPGQKLIAKDTELGERTVRRGQSGRRSERPAATAAAEPAATAAGHEPPVTNPQSLSPTERGGAHADAPTCEADEQPPQLSLVDAPAQPVKAKRQTPHVLPEDWTLSPERVAACLAQRPGLDIDREFARFRRHFLGTRKRWARWDLAWGNWLDRCDSPGQSRSGRSGPYRNPPEEPTQESLRAGWESAGTTGGGNW
jgi:hypothetical protein